MELSDSQPGLRESVEQMEMIYDGANAYLRHADGWTGISLADPGGPLGPYDPLWPLDARSGPAMMLWRSDRRPCAGSLRRVTASPLTWAGQTRHCRPE